MSFLGSKILLGIMGLSIYFGSSFTDQAKVVQGRALNGAP